MTPERIEEIKPYFTNEQLDELSHEYRTMPTDGEGYAIEPEYEGMAARGNIVKLVSDLKASRAALEESQQQNARWKEVVNGLMMADTDVQRDLAEAQQTIAKHEEALNGIIAYSTDKNAVDIASESMGYPEDENEEEKCRYCTGRPLVDREPLMKSQLSDYNVFINSVNYLEDSIIGGSAPHSLYGVKIKYCPVCGKELGKS